MVSKSQSKRVAAQKTAARATTRAKIPWGSTPDKSVTVTPETLLSFESPASSNIDGATYNPTTQELVVKFHGGRSYRYHGVPRDLWDAFEDAESKGHFFAARIKGEGFAWEILKGGMTRGR